MHIVRPRRTCIFNSAFVTSTFSPSSSIAHGAKKVTWNRIAKSLCSVRLAGDSLCFWTCFLRLILFVFLCVPSLHFALIRLNFSAPQAKTHSTYARAWKALEWREKKSEVPYWFAILWMRIASVKYHRRPDCIKWHQTDRIRCEVVWNFSLLQFRDARIGWV